MGETPIALAPGESIDLPLAEPAPIGMYTVTLAGEPAPLPAGNAPVRASWTPDGITAAGDVVPLDARDEVFDAACQTRPFRVAPSRAALAAVRLTAVAPLELAQLEAFA